MKILILVFLLSGCLSTGGTRPDAVVLESVPLKEAAVVEVIPIDEEPVASAAPMGAAPMAYAAPAPIEVITKITTQVTTPLEGGGSKVVTTVEDIIRVIPVENGVVQPKSVPDWITQILIWLGMATPMGIAWYTFYIKRNKKKK